MDRIERIKRNTVYRHFKGKGVIVLDLARHTETNEVYVVYSDLDYEQTWVRPLEMFASEVDHEKYPDAKQKWRFEEVKENAVHGGDCGRVGIALLRGRNA